MFNVKDIMTEVGKIISDSKKAHLEDDVKKDIYVMLIKKNTGKDLALKEAKEIAAFFMANK